MSYIKYQQNTYGTGGTNRLMIITLAKKLQMLEIFESRLIHGCRLQIYSQFFCDDIFVNI